MHLSTRLVALGGLSLLGACAQDSPTGSLEAGSPELGRARGHGGFEVWVVDQSNSAGKAYGGAIHVYEGARLLGAAAERATPTAVLDLGAETADLCRASTGAEPVRPHMLFFNARRSHAVLAFVASGHVVVFDARTRAPEACIRTSPGADGARQAHAAVPTPDGRHIVVANQNGKLLERIDTDYRAGRYRLNPAATLDLAGCTTPNGVACEAPGIRPDNAPICPVVSSNGLAFVTLRGGGHLVVDPSRVPMRIVAEYDMRTVAGNGCGGTEGERAMFVNSGGGTLANLHGFDLYAFPLDAYRRRNRPNRPAPRLLGTFEGDRDGHGTVLAGDGRFLWVMDRAANVAEVFDARGGRHVNTVALAGAASGDPTPDLAGIAPAGNRLFVTLRGPNPLSGDPHVATGTTPGLGIVHLEQGGRRGVLHAVVPITNVDGAGVERADPHGIAVLDR